MYILYIKSRKLRSFNQWEIKLFFKWLFMITPRVFPLSKEGALRTEYKPWTRLLEFQFALMAEEEVLKGENN